MKLFGREKEEPAISENHMIYDGVPVFMGDRTKADYDAREVFLKNNKAEEV